MIAKFGLMDPGDVFDACVVRQAKAYPVYDEAYADNVRAVRLEIAARFPTLHLIGRNGMHKYNNQEPLAKLPQPDEPVALLAFAERACRWIFWRDAANSAIWTTSERICGVDRLHRLCAARGGRV